MDKIRLRFAPAPTGYLHLGGARTALFNWLFARQKSGTFILRVDDTDEERSTEESMRGIFDSLRWLGLDWDEGPEIGGPHSPYVQSERRDIYKEYVQKLLDSGNAYYCYCTKEEIDAAREQAKAEQRTYLYDGKCRNLTEAERKRYEAEGRRPTVRMRVVSGSIVVHDMIKGDVEFRSEDIGDFIIVKSNGAPLYNFTSTIDDSLMNITHIIRGDDHLSNTPKQILMYQALGIEPPQFGHAPMVLGSSKGEKLSKRRHGELVSIDWYQRNGYLPEAVINYLVRLGWSYDDQEEVFSVEELVEKFDIGRVGKSASVFDLDKLQWLNNKYIMKLDIPDRTDLVIPFWRQAGLMDNEEPTADRRAWLEKIVEAVEDRLITFADIDTHTRFFFVDEFEYDKKAVKKWFKGDYVPDMLNQLRSEFAELSPFDESTIEAAIRQFVSQTGLSGIKVMQPIRVATTGTSAGPGLFEVLTLLGRDRVLQRMDRAIHKT